MLHLERIVVPEAKSKLVRIAVEEIQDIMALREGKEPGSEWARETTFLMETVAKHMGFRSKKDRGFIAMVQRAIDDGVVVGGTTRDVRHAIKLKDYLGREQWFGGLGLPPVSRRRLQ